MPPSDYVQEKLSQAVHALATGMGDPRARLRGAYLAMHTLTARDFPDDAMRIRYSALVDTLSAVEATGDEGSIDATVSRMSDAQVSRALNEIWELAGLLS